MSINSLSIITGVIVMLTLGIANGMIKTITEKMGINQFLFFRGVVVAPLVLIIFLINLKTGTFHYQLNWLMMSYIFLIVTLGYFGLTYLYKAYEFAPVGLASPISSFNVVIAIMLSVIFLGLRLETTQTFAIAIIIVAVIALRFEPKSFKRHLTEKNKLGLNYAIIAAFFMGFYFFLVQTPARIIGSLLTPIVSESNGAVVALFAMKVKKEKFRIPDNKCLLQAFIACLLLTIASISLYLGIEKGNLAIVLSLYSTNPIIVTLYGALIYKEKLQSRQYFAVGLLIIGIITLRIFS